MATPFCIAPTLALDGIIDFTTDECRKYFKRAIEKLLDDPFDLATEDRHLLTNLLTERVDEMEWNVDIVGITFILFPGAQAQRLGCVDEVPSRGFPCVTPVPRFKT